MRAILALKPNFPLVRLTLYLLPLGTIPSKLGIASYFIPHQLSLTEIPKYASAPLFPEALDALLAAASFAKIFP